VEFRLVAYDRLGARRGILPVPLEFTPVHTLNELPTISLHYPRWAVGSSYLDNDPEIAFEYCNDGITWVEPRNSRFRLQKVDLDWLDTTATTRYDFIGIGEALRGVPVFDAYGLPLNDEGKVQFPLTNAGQVLNIIWVNARDQRGMLQGYTNNFSQTHDSNGTAYGHQFTTSYDKKTAMSTILDTLVAQGLVDYWWQGRQMNLVKAEAPASFTDHINDGVRFVGSGGSTGVDSAPEQVTHGGLATHVIVHGEDGLRWVFPTNISLPEGRREVVLEYAGVDDQATAQLLAGPHIVRAQNALKNTTRQFHLKADTTILPYKDFKVGDWVPVQRAGGMERMRIQSISITVNEHGAQGYVTLGDKTDELLAKMYKRIQALSGGVKNEGAGTPPTPSSRRPRAATGLVVGNEPYIDIDGNVKSIVTASWAHDGKDVNGDMVDIQEYWFFYRIPGQTNWTLITKTAANSLSWGPLPTYRNGAPATYEFTVEAHSTKGAYSAIASPVTDTMIPDSVPPPIPTNPMPSVWMRTVSLYWDGLGQPNGIGMPKDFDRLKIWESNSSDGAGAVNIANLPHHGQIVIGVRNAGQTYFYAFSTIDKTGNESAKSGWVSVTPASIISNPDIDAIVDELNADIGQNTEDIVAAQGDATQALQDAEAAGQAAIDAAALAAGKSDVVYSPEPPEPSSNTLWIDTDDGNTPYVWSGVLGREPRTNLARNADLAKTDGTLTMDTNLCTTPRGVVAAAFYSSAGAQAITGNVNISSIPIPHDSMTDVLTAHRFTWNPGASNPGIKFGNGIVGQTLYISAWIRVETLGGATGMGLAEASVQAGPTIANTANTWQFVTWTRTTTSTNTLGFRVSVPGASAGSILITGIRISTKPGLFFDGESPDTDDYGNHWTGTAHNSTSVRQAPIVKGSYLNPGTGGAGMAFQSKDAPQGSAFSLKSIQTTANTSGGNWAAVQYTGASPGLAGDIVSAKVRVKFNKPRRVKVLLRPVAADNVTMVHVADTANQFVDVPANEWTWVSVGPVTASADYAWLRIAPLINYGTPNEILAVDDTMQMAQIIIEKKAAVTQPFFTGDHVGATWAGPAHDSWSLYSGPAWIETTDTGIQTAQATADQAITNAALAKDAADAAALAAIAAQSTADGLTTVSAAVPTGADLVGKPVGAMWTQVVAGKVVGAWYKAVADATAWTAMPFDPVMIPQINIGTGTFGDLEGIRMKAKSIGVDKLLVTDQTSYIENGDFETGDMSGWTGVGFTAVTTTPQEGTYCATAVGTGKYMTNKFPVYMSNMVAGKEDEVRVKIWAKTDVAGKIMTVRLVNGVTGSLSSNSVDLALSTAWAEYSVNLKASATGLLKLRIMTHASNAATDNIWVDNVRMYKRYNGEFFVDGSVTALTIAAREVKADHLESDLVLTSEVIAGNPAATHARMNSTGFHVFATDPVTPSNPPREVVRMGVNGSNDYFGVVKPDGNLGATIDENGQGTFDRINIGNGGMRYKGQELETIFNDRPEGIIVWDQWDGSVLPAVANAQERGLFELAFIPNPNRMYKICMSPLMFQATNNVATDAALRLRYTGDGSQPTTLSTPLAEVYHPILTAGGWRQSFQISGRLLRAANGPYVRLLFTIAAAAGQGLFPVANQSVTAWVEDIGPDIPVSGKLSAQTSGGAGGSTPVKVTRTETFASTSSTNYDGAGNVYSNGGNTYMYQGLSPAGYGSLKSLARFNPGNQWWDGRLAGATINNMRLYFYFRHWYNNAGGTAYVGVHSHAADLPSTFSHSGQIMYQPGWPKPGGYWLDIPSTYWANIANATYKGFSLFGDGTYNTYGYADRPTLEITYTK